MSPRTPSIVSRTCERKPAAHAHGNLLEPVYARTVSPSVHPRPASGGATNFFPASALSVHQQALRPPGGEDARCVRPISATQSNCVHPHLARSRLALAAFAARTPRGVFGSTRHYRGTGRFTTSEDRFGGSSSSAALGLYCLTAWSSERGRCLPTALIRSSL
jgi:hypothetical protein